MNSDTKKTTPQDIVKPEHTAVRVALWRALHVEIDPPPHILNDTIGLKIVDEKNWQDRQDMNPEFSKSMRASIVARSRFIEDLITHSDADQISQYVILGAGIDTYAQRRSNAEKKLEIYEVDQPGPQNWKKNRLNEIGYSIPEWLHFVPVDFESGESWWEKLVHAGFNPEKPALFVSTGVSMYLSNDSNQQTLKQLSQLASGSVLAMTFMLTLELMAPQERRVMEFVMRKAAESGTPFKSLYAPSEIIRMSLSAGFKSAHEVSFSELAKKYFSDRTDGLRPPEAESFLIAKT